MYTRKDIHVALQAAAAGNGMSVHTVLRVTIPFTIKWLIENHELGIEYLPVAAAFTTAGHAACSKGAFNTVGGIPRGELEAAHVSYAQVRYLLEVVVRMDLGNEETNSYFSQYGTSSLFSRYPPYAALNDHKASLKWGDSIKWPRFHQPQVTLESPAAWRYGSTIASNFLSEWFGFGYDNRVVRVLNEFLICWLARDIACKSEYALSPLTGDEGVCSARRRRRSTLCAPCMSACSRTRSSGRRWRLGGATAAAAAWPAAASGSSSRSRGWHLPSPDDDRDTLRSGGRIADAAPPCRLD